MNTFNDNNELKHPAFHDEEVKQTKWSKILDTMFRIFIVLGLVAWVLFSIWMAYFNERVEL